MFDSEYLDITNKIFENNEFKKLKYEVHHINSNRLDHSICVSKKTYKVCKKFNLDYKSATKAALLHDFFFDDEFFNKKDQMLNHPKKAVENSLKITDLTDKEINIIESHMYPIGKKLPKYKESVIVNAIDDYVSIKERVSLDYAYFKTAVSFLIIVLINIIY